MFHYWVTEHSDYLCECYKCSNTSSTHFGFSEIITIIVQCCPYRHLKLADGLRVKPPRSKGEKFSEWQGSGIHSTQLSRPVSHLAQPASQADQGNWRGHTSLCNYLNYSCFAIMAVLELLLYTNTVKPASCLHHYGIYSGTLLSYWIFRSFSAPSSTNSVLIFSLPFWSVEAPVLGNIGLPVIE